MLFDRLAVTEDCSVLKSETKREGNRTFITIKKEELPASGKVRIFGELTAARTGDDGFYLLPRNIGMTGDFCVCFRLREDVTYAVSKPVMSLFGIKKDGLCALVRIDRNYKYALRVTVRNGMYTLEAEYDFSDHDAPYDDLRFEIIELPPDSGYADMARAERETRLARGEITPLSEKCKRPAVEYARKYPLIRIRMGWKESPSPVVHQTPENEPPMRVACDFARVRDIADELLRQGVEGAELQLVGWNKSGHDGRFPQLFPAEPLLGGNEGLKQTIEYVKSKGFRISLHDNLIDEYEIADVYTPDDIAVNRSGKYIQIGHYGGGYAYHVCPKKQEKNMRRNIPLLKELGLNGLHFTDVISIVEPDDCHAPGHECTTGEGIRTVCQIMDAEREAYGGFSSEGTMDFAVGHIDYGLYVSFGDGFGKKIIPVADKIIPFFELVYHGIILYNPTSPTVNYTIKSPRDRLTFILRGGRPTFYLYSKFRTGAANWMGEDDLTADSDEDLSRSVSMIKRGLDEYRSTGLDSLQTVFMRDYRIDGDGTETAEYENGTVIKGYFGTDSGSKEKSPAPMMYTVSRV